MINTTKDRWSALSMQQRADLIKLYTDNGITDIKVMRKDYNGIPYRDFNTSEYDYFNAHPSNAPTKEGEHWTSRNPKTGQLLKREDHPTFDLMIEGEKQAGYKVIRGYNGELYSIPNEPNNYVEDYNSFATGGPTEEILNLNTNEPLITREEYLNRQRQNIITQSIENSNSRIQPAVPYINKYINENDWKNQLNESKQSLLNLIEEATINNLDEKHINMYIEGLKSLEDEYNKGFIQTSIPGATCIYTATDNYGKKYRVAGNKSFRSSPKKYGFEEVNLNDIKEGDIIQDFSVNGTPTHAVTFIGYDDKGKALFNYSSGDYTNEAIQKRKHYPFYSEYGDPLFLNNEDNSDLRTYAAAYRFIGTQEDNDMWNGAYNQLRKNYAQNITNELKNVPSPIKGKAIQLNKTKLLTK